MAKDELLSQEQESAIFADMYALNRFILLNIIHSDKKSLQFCLDRKTIWEGMGGNERLLWSPLIADNIDAAALNLPDNVVQFMRDTHLLRPALHELLVFFQDNPDNPSELKKMLGAAFRQIERKETVLLNKNENLVISIAKKRLGGGVDFEDFFQAGCLGLLKAIWKFDYTRRNPKAENSVVGNRLSTVAVYWIEQEIKNFKEKNNNGNGGRIPTHLQSMWAIINHIKSTLTEQKIPHSLEKVNELFFAHIERENSVLLNEKREVLLERIAVLYPIQPVLSYHASDDDSSVIDNIADGDHTHDEAVWQAEMALWQQHADAVKTVLNAKEWQIVQMLHGIGLSGYALKHFEIADLMGLKPQTVQNLYKGALQKLNKYLETE